MRRQTFGLAGVLDLGRIASRMPASWDVSDVCNRVNRFLFVDQLLKLIRVDIDLEPGVVGFKGFDDDTPGYDGLGGEGSQRLSFD
jgi:hypothetical protein